MNLQIDFKKMNHW